MFGLDRAIFQWINQWPESFAPFFRFLSLGIKGSGLRTAFVLLAVGLLWWPKTRKATLLALASWPLANSITNVLKAAFPTERPCIDFPATLLRVEKLDSFGTASAHSANMAAVAFAFFLCLRPWKGMDVRLKVLMIFWTLVAFFTGLSRIYVGVHYPSQVMIGWFVGCLTAWIVVTSWEAGARLYQIRKVRTDQDRTPEDQCMQGP